MGKIYAAYTMKKAPLAVTNELPGALCCSQLRQFFLQLPIRQLSPFSLLQDLLRLGCGGIPLIHADLASDLSL